MFSVCKRSSNKGGWHSLDAANRGLYAGVGCAGGNACKNGGIPNAKYGLEGIFLCYCRDHTGRKRTHQPEPDGMFHAIFSAVLYAV